MSVVELQGVRAGRAALPTQRLKVQKLVEALGGLCMVLVTLLGVASRVPKSRFSLPPATFLSIKSVLPKAVCGLLRGRGRREGRLALRKLLEGSR